MPRIFYLLTLALCLMTGLSRAREFSVVTYNVENLFDASKVSLETRICGNDRINTEINDESLVE